MNGPGTVAREILELVKLANDLGGVSTVRPQDFRHVVTGQGQRLVPNTGDIRLGLFGVPANAAYVITFLSLRSFFNEALGNREPWPYEEIDQRGYGSIRFRVNASQIGRPDNNYLLLANHPCLFAFDPGAQVELLINRSDNASGIVGFPSIVNIAFRLNGYLTTSSVGQRFQQLQTRPISVPANQTLL